MCCHQYINIVSYIYIEVLTYSIMIDLQNVCIPVEVYDSINEDMMWFVDLFL